MVGLSELVLRSAEIRQFAPGVDVNGPLLEIQLKAFDMQDNLEPYDLTVTLQRYARRRPQRVIVEEPKAAHCGNWESDDVWPGEIEIGGLHVRGGQFEDVNTGFRFGCSRCWAFDRSGSGKLLNIQTVGEICWQAPEDRATELYCHELMEALYVGGIRICDPHTDSYMMHRAMRDLMERGYGA